ncbi:MULTISPECIES: hypothetical protein [Rhodopseudomonas]|uniref:PepSY domain-containing protein n=1 Tax=Rhodopseudomonas palustris TaxID=1076 RepID=A0A0D7EF10_RHOPL|nr:MULTISPECIES: hypothetical protein [Rhodopseudomonas]KIZ39394.1 hypothetical protein OO17_20555 [Rhodopseudomonas palustris]MDF3809584.1 hypothetical protein [Rhodopseudomonas sp. BAL398]WOK17780.1 hypothetical protein RBJ75_27310 [Rhodopseudomonas sp. BAL398]
MPRITTSSLAAVMLALLPISAVAQIDAPPAAPCALRGDAPVETTAAMQRLLAKIKARYPKASILRIDRTSQDLEGRILTYMVKVFPPDGRIVWLKFDARTLEPLDGASAESGGRRDCKIGHS